MKKHILIVEDDPFVATFLSKLLIQHEYHIIAIKDNIEGAWLICKKEKVDLVLLDIKLTGGEKGTNLGKRIRKEKLPIKIVYLTGFADKANISEIMETKPELFLIKPFHSSVLIANIQLVFKKTYFDKELEFTDKKKVFRFLIKDILYIQSDGNYIKIYCNNSPMIVLREQLRYVEQQIKSHDFLRVHQRFLINTSWVTTVNKNYIYIDNTRIPISNPYKKSVLDKYNL